MRKYTHLYGKPNVKFIIWRRCYSQTVRIKSNFLKYSSLLYKFGIVCYIFQDCSKQTVVLGCNLLFIFMQIRNPMAKLHKQKKRNLMATLLYLYVFQ